MAEQVHPPVIERLWPVEVLGPRVGLREASPDDTPALVRVFGDPEVVRHIPPPVQTLASEQAFLADAVAQAQRSPRLQYQLAVTLRTSGEVIGMARIGVNSLEHRRGDVGYGVRRDLWNQGLSTEVLECLVRFGFEDLRLHRIQGVHHPDNPASGRVMTKVGFVMEGRIRDHLYVKGAWRDSIAFALLEDEWRSRR